MASGTASASIGETQWNKQIILQIQIIVTIENIEKIYEFIEAAINNGEGVLFFSLRGQSRALTALTAYLMYKYSWNLNKTVQFLSTRKKDFEITQAFLNQLKSFEKDYLKGRKLSSEWDNNAENQEIQIIQNTYLNSLRQPPMIQKTVARFSSPNETKQNVTWSINLIQQIQTIEPNEDKQTPKELKSILKGSSRLLKKDKQLRSISVNDNSKPSLEDFILQNMLITKKLQTPKINSFSLENKGKKKDLTEGIISQHRARPKRPQHFTPERQRIMQNTKQIMDTYLNSQINNIQLMRGRSIYTPQKERIRAVSQFSQSPNKTPSLTKQQFFIENQIGNFMKWSLAKKQPQFKIR
ncbi:unnamed protein product (macronuclear) [Paramecium tetraurelia]|uniref:Dual specificity phosphatase catalytic domain-containing protein n=1 Tax=Paramecium tetraurelia TaxID=5888 RepID=A0BFJ5_PARTE|nr:uncharacterized protein GSPATT00028347001 [Paramecium tetraurelia]CAK57312.1 unnamed protein product [Paramecium tetraurelia]|eukprot:XP_001424710.1 hypothetical protein (macronuclear) [Paramecium tetraurelia strain d4-2]